MSARRALVRRGTATSVLAEFKTMALSFGADRLLDTVLRPGRSGRVRPPGMPGVPPESWAARSCRKAARWRVPVFGQAVGGLRLSPCARSAFRTCPEATQWKVLVTFLSIWLCPDVVSDPRGLAGRKASPSGWLGSRGSVARRFQGMCGCPG